MGRLVVRLAAWAWVACLTVTASPAPTPVQASYTYATTVTDGVPDFVDLSNFTGATALSLGDDSVSSALPIGFSFTFFSQTYSSVYVSSNGFVSFALSSSGCCTGQVLPNSASPNGLIAGCWEDLDPSEGGEVLYATVGISPNREFIVHFHDIEHYSSGNPVDFQIALKEQDMGFEIRHKTLAGNGGWGTRTKTV